MTGSRDCEKINFFVVNTLRVTGINDLFLIILLRPFYEGHPHDPHRIDPPPIYWFH